VAWTQFVAEFYEHFDTETHHLGHFTQLKQSSTMKDFIDIFECLDFHMKGMWDVFFWEFFISGIKDQIHAHVLMDHPYTWVESTEREKEEQHVFF
jgi:hypothetical protein